MAYKFFVILMVISLTACSKSVSIFIFNNSDTDINIMVFMVGAEKHDHAKAITLKLDKAQGKPTHIGDIGSGWGIDMSSERCTFQYTIPSIKTFKYFTENPSSVKTDTSLIKVQIEPDYQIYLVPQIAEKVVNVEDYIDMQNGGFPLKPTQKICPNDML